LWGYKSYMTSCFITIRKKKARGRLSALGMSVS
jgi:hypothetical protein